jgi:hypothetical protein
MIPFLLAQAVVCGQYGSSPASIGGCYLPYPNNGGGAYLQQVQGQALATPIQPGPAPAPYAIWNQPGYFGSADK